MKNALNCRASLLLDFYSFFFFFYNRFSLLNLSQAKIFYSIHHLLFS